MYENVLDCHTSDPTLVSRVLEIDKMLFTVAVVDWKCSSIWYPVFFISILFQEYWFFIWLIFVRTYLISLKDLRFNHAFILQMAFFLSPLSFAFVSCLSLHYFLIIWFSPDWPISFQLLFDNFDISETVKPTRIYYCISVSLF